MDRIILFLLLITFTFWNCNVDKNVPEQQPPPLPPPPPIGKYYTNFSDEVCQQQMIEAKNDIKQGKLVYEHNSGWDIVRYDEEMEEILLRHGIEYRDLGMNCTLDQECYGYYMDSIITDKFGTNFIEKIELEADSLFLSRWQTKIYDYWDIDVEPLYRNINAEIFIAKRIQLPPEWDTIPMKNERQFIEIVATINNMGKLQEWNFDETSNLKPSNEHLLQEIKRKVSSILVDMPQWIPGKLNDKNVTSRIWLDIDLDRNIPI
mgnify:CR=1 FL=1